MIMPAVTPTPSIGGVPLSMPVEGLKTAHEGRLFVLLKLMVLVAVGVKLYRVPALTNTAGVPEMVKGICDFTLWLSIGDVLPARVVSPAYTAVMLCILMTIPETEMLAVPLMRLPDPRKVLPSS